MLASETAISPLANRRAVMCASLAAHVTAILVKATALLAETLSLVDSSTRPCEGAVVEAWVELTSIDPPETMNRALKFTVMVEALIRSAQMVKLPVPVMALSEMSTAELEKTVINVPLNEITSYELLGFMHTMTLSLMTNDAPLVTLNCGEAKRRGCTVGVLPVDVTMALITLLEKAHLAWYPST